MHDQNGGLPRNDFGSLGPTLRRPTHVFCHSPPDEIGSSFTIMTRPAAISSAVPARRRSHPSMAVMFNSSPKQAIRPCKRVLGTGSSPAFPVSSIQCFEVWKAEQERYSLLVCQLSIETSRLRTPVM